MLCSVTAQRGGWGCLQHAGLASTAELLRGQSFPSTVAGRKHVFPAHCQGRGTTQQLCHSEVNSMELRFVAGWRWLQALALPGWFPHISIKHGEQLVSLPLH